MADMIMRQKGPRKAPPPRIDFTPMVDLGFLLITFFMISTTLAKPKTLVLNMPDPTPAPNPTAYPEESTVSVILTANHKVAYYFGTLTDVGQLRSVPLTAVRNMLLKKKEEVSQLPASFSAEAHKMHVVLKPSCNCKYEDVVYAIDEMTICHIDQYALTDMSADEQIAIEKMR